MSQCVINKSALHCLTNIQVDLFTSPTGQPSRVLTSMAPLPLCMGMNTPSLVQLPKDAASSFSFPSSASIWRHKFRGKITLRPPFPGSCAEAAGVFVTSYTGAGRKGEAGSCVNTSLPGAYTSMLWAGTGGRYERKEGGDCDPLNLKHTPGLSEFRWRVFTML